jgi:hypothetical protein
MPYRNGLLIVIGLLIVQACVAVKPYQKMYLNDAEMVTAPKKAERPEISFQSYREGSSGANGGKSGGGCGCN